MSIEFLRPLFQNGVSVNKLGINYQKTNVSFNGELTSDRFESNSTNRYTSEFYLRKAIQTNPKIQSTLNEVGVPVKLHMQQLNNLLNNHASDTKRIAEGIADNLPFSLKSKINLKAVSDGAYLHDLGKALIPEEILNKNGKLNAFETEIMHRHAILGYELLKNSDIDRTTLNIIKNHHQNAKKTGYPFADKNFNADLNLQIVSIADKYSALTEKRAYKKAMDDKTALTIIYKDVKDGKIHPFVFKALVNYVNKTSAGVATTY